MDEPHSPTLGNGKICYLEIPTDDITSAAAFYRDVFGWQTRTRDDGHIAFDDGVGQVSGTWVTDRLPSTNPGMLVYVMVDDIATTMAAAEHHGGKVVQGVGHDAPEITARITDPFGNIVGLFQQRDL